MPFKCSWLIGSKFHNLINKQLISEALSNGVRECDWHPGLFEIVIPLQFCKVSILASFASITVTFTLTPLDWWDRSLPQIMFSSKQRWDMTLHSFTSFGKTGSSKVLKGEWSGKRTMPEKQSWLFLSKLARLPETTPPGEWIGPKDRVREGPHCNHDSGETVQAFTMLREWRL